MNALAFRLGTVVALLLAPAVATAATIVVDTTADSVATDGHCSLREAVSAANLDAAVDACTPGDGDDRIELEAGTYTLELAGGEDANASGDFDVDGTVTVAGVGADETILDGAGIDRLFDVREGATLRLEGLTLTGGHPPTPGGTGEAGAPGGAVRSLGSLHIDGCTLTGNQAGTGGPEGKGGDGGAIWATAVTVSDSVLQGNASGDGGETTSASTLPGNGGAIFATGTTRIDRTRIEGNRLGYAGASGPVAVVAGGTGGAISTEGDLHLEDDAFAGNGDGGLQVQAGTVWAGSTATILRTSFTDNTALNGSALYLNLSGDGTLRNLTVEGNHALEAPDQTATQGGAIFAAEGWIKIHSSTLVANEGGCITNDSANLMLGNSIIACHSDAASLDWDCAGQAPFSMGHNLVSPGGGCEAGALGDLETTVFGLGPLSTDERLVPSFYPLLATSVAVDAGSCGDFLPPFDNPVKEDIRRNSRPAGKACDIGAFEYIEPTVAFRTVDEAPGAGCPDGGVRVELGLDDNTNGRLDDEEVETTALVCNGAAGASCTVTQDAEGNAVVTCDDGTSVTVPAGAVSLMRLEEEPAGDHCPSGGQQVLTGVDADRDGVLDAEEVESTAYVCAGLDGASGASCSVEKTADGGARITCPDGSSTTIPGPPDEGGCAAGAGGLSLLGLLCAGGALRRRRD